MKFIVVLALGFTAQGCYADNGYSQASTAALQALYVQTGLSDYIDTYAKYLDKEYMPDRYRGVAAVAGVMLQGAVRQQLSYKWSF